VFGFKSIVLDHHKPKAYFTCSFQDESNCLIRRNTTDQITEVSIGSINGLYIQQTSDGVLYQTYPRKTNGESQTFATGFQGLLSNKPGKMHTKLHDEEQVLAIYDESTQSVKKSLCKEVSRTNVITVRVTLLLLKTNTASLG
jgi:hypothetical protein